MLTTDIRFIPQEYSWGRLCLISVAFEHILDCTKAFPYFLELVNAYVVKTHEDERMFYGLRSCQVQNLDVVDRQGLWDSFHIRCNFNWIQSFVTIFFMWRSTKGD